MKIHDVKLKQIYFDDVVKGIKPFMILEAYTPYKKGDILVITEVCPLSKKSPRKTMKTITYVEFGSGRGLSKINCVVCLEPCDYEITKDSKIRSIISESDQIKIIHFWKTEKNNTVDEIRKHFYYSKGSINNLLDNHLKPKPNGDKSRNSGTN